MRVKLTINSPGSEGELVLEDATGFIKDVLEKVATLWNGANDIPTIEVEEVI